MIAIIYKTIVGNPKFLNACSFLLGVLVSTLFSVYIQGTFESRDRRSQERSAASSAKNQLKTECERYQKVFQNYYANCPVITCGINLYKLPKIDPTFIDYVNRNRDSIEASFGDEGLTFVRSIRLSYEAQEKLTLNIERPTISRHAYSFSAYIDPLKAACKFASVDIDVQKCPYDALDF